MSELEEQAKFLAGAFFDYELPKDKVYLLKYFRSMIARQFLRYYLFFGNHTYFKEHTGIHCDKMWKYVLTHRIKRITALHAKAKSELTEENIEFLDQIEKGRLSKKHQHSEKVKY